MPLTPKTGSRRRLGALLLAHLCASEYSTGTDRCLGGNIDLSAMKRAIGYMQGLWAIHTGTTWGRLWLG